MSRSSRSIGWQRRHSIVGSFVGRLIAAVRRRRARKETIAMLSALDDRTLSDIGIVRDQIPQIADRLARRYR